MSVMYGGADIKGVLLDLELETALDVCLKAFSAFDLFDTFLFSEL
jgi:hypothetical protein